MTARAAAWVGLLLAALATQSAPAADDQPSPRAGGRLLWVAPGKPNLVGRTWLDLPLVSTATGELFLWLDKRLTIDKATDGFTFGVEDLRYAIDLGWRDTRYGQPLSVVVGQRGREAVDASGQGFVQYVAIGVHSRRTPDRWSVAAGPVFNEQEARASALVRGNLAWPLTGWLGLDVEVDGLIEAGRFDADAEGGPRLSFGLGGERVLSLLVRYHRGRHPFGLDEDGWVIGLAFDERAPSPPSEAPDVDGRLFAGAGEGREAARAVVRFVSPASARGWRGVLLVDANVLTAKDTGELYYRYHAGVERPLLTGFAGAYYYHRSNHTLAEPNGRITSTDVLEIGWETPGWHRVRPAGEHRLVLDGYARGGWLADSEFGEDRSWHVRGGVRLSLAAGRLASPYLLAELERGDVRRELFAIGVALGRALAVQVEYRSDSQYFGSDRDAWLASLGYGF